jgi:arylformamidase
MEFIDISVPISSRIPIWPDNPGVALEPVQRIAAGGVANVSGLSLGTHTGTHVDAPWHFLDDGPRVDELSLAQLVGPCEVVDVTAAVKPADGVTAAVLQRACGSPPAPRLLVRTGNSELWDGRGFSSEYSHLTPDAAEWIVAAGVRVIGIDYLSVERYKAPGAPVHRTLLGAGVIIIEGLNLAEVAPGSYELICLPLRVAGADGAPARVILRA